MSDRQQERIRQLEALLVRAASCITDAEEEHGTFDTDNWTRDEIQKRWEFWRAYWTYGDPIPREDWPAEYRGERWDACEECDFTGWVHIECEGHCVEHAADCFRIESCDTCDVYATDDEARAAHDAARPQCGWVERWREPQAPVCTEVQDFVEVRAKHARCSDPFYIVARISDGQFVQFPCDLTDWTGASNLAELIRDGFILTGARGSTDV